MEMSWAFDGDLMVKSCKNRALYGNIIQKLGFNGNIILKCEKTHNWGYVCWDNQQEYEDLTSMRNMVVSYGGVMRLGVYSMGYSMDFNRS